MYENLRKNKRTYSESIFKSWFIFWNGAVYLQVSLLEHNFQSNFLGTFWLASRLDEVAELYCDTNPF